MPENTPRLNIPKPLNNEYFNRTNFREILDVIDENAATKQETENLTTDFETLELDVAAHKADDMHLQEGERDTWNGKQDAIGYTPINKAGDAMTGRLDLSGYSEKIFTTSLGVPMNPSDYPVFVLNLTDNTAKTYSISENTIYPN